MKKVTSANYKKDKYYIPVTRAFDEILQKSNVVAPIDVFIEMGHLTE